MDLVAEGWRQLDASLGGLDEEALSRPGVVEEWSVKDLLGHVAAWERIACRMVDDWRRGEPVGGLAAPSVDDLNAAEAAARRDWSAARVRAEAEEVRGLLRAALESLGDDDWHTVVGEGERRRSLGDWLGGALGGPGGPGTHEVEHAQHIWAWRLACEGRRAGQLALLMETRCALLQWLEGLADDALDGRPAQAGAWPARDLLAHLAAWDSLMARVITAWIDGAAPPAPVTDHDAFNACAAGEARSRSLAAVLVVLARAHDEFLAAVHRAGGRAGVFPYPYGGSGDLDGAVRGMAGHERAHLEELRAGRRVH